jgi:hypothetical protein
MTQNALPSTLALWLEEALAGWILPIASLLLAGAAWGLYVLGLLPEGPTAAALAILVALLVALLMVRPALSASVDPLTRGLVLGAAVLAALLCIGGAFGAAWPGAPLAEGEIARAGEALPLPAGLSGRVKVLVHAGLPAGGTPQVDFRLGGTVEPLTGRVERTVSSVRVGRGGRANVAHDINETWAHGTLAPGATALTLERLNGPVAGTLHVAVFQDLMPPVIFWALAALALLAAAVAESRMTRGSVAALCGMALAYGLLVAWNATPSQAVGTSVGAILLGGLSGALAGGLAALLAKLGPWRGAAAAPAEGAGEAEGTDEAAGPGNKGGRPARSRRRARKA